LAPPSATGFRADDEWFALLRHLTTPVVAVTTAYGGRGNGFIINSAQRASLVPAYPRISFYCSKPNFSHDLILQGGVFAIHLLRRDQWAIIEQLGLRSGRDGDKLAGLPLREGGSSCPVLTDCVAAYECTVANTMDAGAATFILGDVVDAHVHDAAAEIMTSEHFRAHAPPDLRARYEANLVHARAYLAPLARHIARTPDAGTG
jgi:flavin reductase (DIM6/NTAB) family NADH-FMN oxidoreductase RutF